MSDAEDDYMSMVIEEPTQKETFTQRKKREQREVRCFLFPSPPPKVEPNAYSSSPSIGVLHNSPFTSVPTPFGRHDSLIHLHLTIPQAEARARVPSKAERAAQEAARRDEALAKSTLDPTNKGFQMMARLGFKPGQTLGKKPHTSNPSTTESTPTIPGSPSPSPFAPPGQVPAARTEPLNLIFKEGRGGIGLDSEKKRKIREQAEEATKKMKTEEGDYRDRVREERETRRAEAQVRAAQKVAERLDAEMENSESEGVGQDDALRVGTCVEERSSSSPDDTQPCQKKKQAHHQPTSQINVLYRGLVREREERERSVQARHTLETSLPSSFFPRANLPGYSDATLDEDDQQALGTRDPYTAIVEQEVEEEDPELDAFNALAPTERLHKLVLYLRDRYRYCFWCKYQYGTDEELEGCPGLTEEDHD